MDVGAVRMLHGGRFSRDYLFRVQCQVAFSAQIVQTQTCLVFVAHVLLTSQSVQDPLLQQDIRTLQTNNEKKVLDELRVLKMRKVLLHCKKQANRKQKQTDMYSSLGNRCTWTGLLKYLQHCEEGSSSRS